MKIGLIGKGAIARYVSQALTARGDAIGAILVRPETALGGVPPKVGSVDDLPRDLDLILDCAGHEALATHGPPILARGLDMITLSLGALANPETETRLRQAAQAGGSTLHLASGAIGALDCLTAAKVGSLASVTYTGRKPPRGWKGSPAESRLDLDALAAGTHVHFEGTARAAALAYPKNANVAAAVALAGLGFDATNVRLIADTGVTRNIHEVTATGDFGRFEFRIEGSSLPDNPRSSMLAAMSVLSKLDQITQRIVL